MKARDAKDIFVGGGEMGELMRSQDWSQTPLGSVEQWPQSLRSALSICLNSRFPIAIYWGVDRLLLYNDAWRPIVGDKHPWALGQPGQDVWPEIWDDIGPEFAKVFATGEGIFHSDELLAMHRFGYTEECFFDYTFNPIQGEGGGVEGIFNVVSETTYRVLNDRRARFLRALASSTGNIKTIDGVCKQVVETLQANSADIPFSLLYRIDADHQFADRCSETEGDTASTFFDEAVDEFTAPKQVDLNATAAAGWPIAQVIRTAQPYEITDLVARFGSLPGSSWPEPPQEAVVLPIIIPGQAKVFGALVAVASPRRQLDDNYRDFFNQIAAQIATAIATAQAYEEERQRSEALAELDRAKTVFFSNISHEFRTPLTLMLNPLEDTLAALEEWEHHTAPLPPSPDTPSPITPPTHPSLYPSTASPVHPSILKAQLQIAHRNSQRLLKLVNTLLDFSRIEAGRVQASYEPTDLAMLTADLAGVFRSAVERAGLTLVVECPPLPEPAYVDRDMWEKIVLNLLSNAFKFTFAGEIRVSLRESSEFSVLSPELREETLSQHSKPNTQNSKFVLEVCDTGTGIPAEELPHIFKRFHRVRGARGRSYEGSGIGLSLVQELVHLHGGTIEVSSVMDQGTTFTVVIPTGSAHLPCDRINADRTLASTATGATPYVEEALRWLPDEGEWVDGWTGDRVEALALAPAPDPSTSPPTHPSTPLPKILLADDNADMLDYVKRLLSQHYDVVAVRDGKAALAAIRQQRPDLVLTDVMMPELDGFELLRQLRGDPKTQELPIILLSARAGEEARIEGLAAGADDYLVKPFAARELLARVEAALKLMRLRQEAKVTIQRSEERSRLALQVAQLGTWRYDPMSDQVELDEHMREIWGEPADAERLPLAQVMQRIHPADRERLVNIVSAALEPPSSGTYAIDYRIIWDDGTERWIAANGQAIFAGEGQQRHAIEFLGTALDITDRRSTEAALRESEELTQRILDSSNDCIKVLALDGNILYMNTGGLLTIEADDPALVLNRNWIDFWQDDEREQAIAAIAAAKAGNVGRMQGYCPTLNGEPKWWDVVVTPLRDATEQVAKLVVVSRDITEQKQAETALRESEERFRCMADNAPMMVWVSNPEGRCTYLSQTWYDFSGQTEATGLGMGWLDAVHPADREITKTTFLAANERQEAFQLEYRLRRKDGEYRWAIDAASPWFGVDSQFKGFIGSVMDISDLKGVEEALRRRETELRLVTNSVPALISFIDAEQRYRFTNQEYEDWFARPISGSIYGKHIRDVVGEAAYAEIRPYVEQVLAGQQVTFERQILYNDGITRHVSATYVPRFDNRGTVEGFVALVNDISEIKQAEVALRQSEERYRYLAESIPQLVWTSDAEGQLLDINQRWTEFTGLTLEQARAEGWQAVIHPDDIPILGQKWALAQQEGTNYQAEGRMRQANGVYRWHLHQAVPLKTKRGKVIKWFGTATDIEEQKQLEQQRSRLLQQEQAARAAAEAANRTKDEFLAVVSHELRSPLNPILGWATLLRNGKLDEAKTQKALAVIERNAKLQTELIDDLLDISRMLRGKLEITVRPVNLAATIQAAIETVRLAAEAKSIEITLNLDPDVGPVSGDITRLQQIVWNLLSNAVKFTPDGGQVEVRLEQVDGESESEEIRELRSQGVSVSASQGVGQPESQNMKGLENQENTTPSAHPPIHSSHPPIHPSTHPPTYSSTHSSYARITVSDTGKGITADFLPYIFDYFRQADSATTRQFGGLGLGLAIVRHLVELHGGTIHASSAGEDKGATFIVTLPTLSAQRRAEQANRFKKPPLDLQDIRILVVDDEPDTRDITSFVLKQAGAKVTSAASAQEALTALREAQPQILISDIGMPDMDGYALMRQIRRLPPEQGGQIPAIALTAYAAEIDYQHVMAAGFQKHVPKPVEPDELVEAVASLVKQQRWV